MVPQLTIDESPSPRNSRPASARIAAVAAPKNEPAMSEVMFGRISWNTTRNELSPENRAAVTKSRERRDCVWLRSTRAPQAHPVITMTAMIIASPPFWR
jgi:hypothetical protein